MVEVVSDSLVSISASLARAGLSEGREGKKENVIDVSIVYLRKIIALFGLVCGVGYCALVR